MTIQSRANLVSLGGATEEVVTACPALFEAPTVEKIAELKNLTEKAFCSWQFERLLNSAADLLERANAEREMLIATLISDLEQSQSLSHSELSVSHDEKRHESNDAGPCYANLQPFRLQKYLEFTGNINVKDYSKGVFGAYQRQAGNLVELTKTESAAQRLQAAAEKDGVEAQLYQLYAEYSAAEMELRRTQEELERSKDAVKLSRTQLNERRKAADEGGLLDYKSRATLLARQLLRDYFEASARFHAAETGLSDVLAFDKAKAVPTPEKACILDQIPELLLVVRDRIHWHAARTQLDQGFTVVVSLRQFCTAEQWQESFLKGLPLPFEPDKVLFAQWWLPRIRGIAASYTGSERRTIRLGVTLPEQAARSDGHEFSQKRFPSCSLGRVWNREATREVEINGAVTLMNACPIGATGFKWMCAIEGLLKGHDLAIDDVELEMNCIGIPRTSKDEWKLGSWAEVA